MAGADDKDGLLSALGMDVSFRKNNIRKVNKTELGWLGKLDTMFDNERDPNKDEHLKEIDREIHKATAGFFHSM